MKVLVADKKLSNKDKVIPLTSLGVYHTGADNQAALAYMRQAINIAKQEQDKKYGVYAYSSLAAFYGFVDSLSLCYSAIDTCMWYIDNTTDPQAKAQGLNSMVIVKEMLGEKEHIADMLLEGLELTEKIASDDPYKFGLQSKLHMSLFHYYLPIDPTLAKKHAIAAKEAGLAIENLHLVMQAWSGLSLCYREIYEKHPMDKSILDSAIYASDRSLMIYEDNAKSVSNEDYADALENKAYIYLLQNRIDSTAFYANKLISYAKDTGVGISYQSSGYNLLSKIELSKNNLREAERLKLLALSIIEDAVGYFDLRYTLCGELSGLYKKDGNYSKALEYAEKTLEYFKINNEEIYLKEARLAEAKLKTKENAYQLDKANKQNQIYFLYLIVSVVIFVGLILLILILRLRAKNSKQRALIANIEKEEAELLTKIKEKEAEELISEKKIIELQLESEKNKALLNAHEVNKLQKELLAGNLQLDHKRETIKKIKQKITEDINTVSDVIHIERLLKEDKKQDGNFEEFAEYVKKIHPTFYIQLQERTHQKLTPLDLKYCTFILMNLSTKDIASLLYIEPKTVRMTKYRLKQKLNLDKEEDLHTFIHNLASNE